MRCVKGRCVSLQKGEVQVKRDAEFPLEGARWLFQGWGWAICGATLPAAACPVHAKHPDMLQRAGARAGAAGWLVIALLELSAPALASSSALGAAVLRHRGTQAPCPHARSGDRMAEHPALVLSSLLWLEPRGSCGSQSAGSAESDRTSESAQARALQLACACTHARCERDPPALDGVIKHRSASLRTCAYTKETCNCNCRHTPFPSRRPETHAPSHAHRCLACSTPRQCSRS